MGWKIKKESFIFLVLAIVIVLLIRNINAVCPETYPEGMVFCYGFEDWGGSIAQTPNYPVSSNYEGYCQEHENSSEVVTNYDGLSSYSGDYFLLHNHWDGTLDPLVEGITQGSINWHANIGSNNGDTSPSCGNNPFDIEQEIEGEVFVTFRYSMNGWENCANVNNCKLKLMRFYEATQRDVIYMVYPEYHTGEPLLGISYTDNLYAGDTNPDFDNGNWHRISMYANYNTGETAIWFDEENETLNNALIYDTWPAPLEGAPEPSPVVLDGNWCAFNPEGEVWTAIDDIEVWDRIPDSSYNPQPNPECTSAQTRSCDTGLLGICANGTESCVDGNWSGNCVQDQEAITEICDNGLDDDCDGLIDLEDEENCGSGNDYHVATTGSDSTGDGSLSNPWRTPEYGASQLSSGNTLYIHGGTYEVIGSTDPLSPTIESEADYITIRNYPGDEVIIEGYLPEGETEVGMVLGASASASSGITISGQKYKGLTIKGCVWIGWNTENITLENCDISVCGCKREGDNFHECVRLAGARNAIIRNNSIHDNLHGGSNAPLNRPLIMEYDTTNAIIENNKIYNSVGPCVRLKDDPVNITIRYNHISNCNAPPGNDSHMVSGVSVGGQSHVAAHNNKVYQNIIEDSYSGVSYVGLTENFEFYNNLMVNNQQCIGYISAMDSGFGVTINPHFYVWNNICYNTTEYNIDTRWVNGGVSSFDYLDYNLYSENEVWFDRNYPDTSYTAYSLTDWQTYSGFELNSIVGDPLFIDFTNRDYKLQSNSPAINSGIDRQDHDSDGDTTENINIGAYITGEECIGLLSDCLSQNNQIYHPADNNPQDGIVSFSEIGDYLDRWLNGEITLDQLLGGINKWRGL